MPPDVNHSENHLVHVATARWGDGEFFGGLAVAAIAVHRQTAVALQAMGLKGWREAQPRELQKLAQHIERVAPTERLLIEPTRYNKSSQSRGGIADLMHWAHGRVARELCDRFPECQAVLCEPIPGLSPDDLGLKGMLVLAPGDGYENVACEAAGAVARWLYTERRSTLQEKLGLCFEGDAATVGRDILRHHGEPMLYRIAKMDSPIAGRILNGGQA